MLRNASPSIRNILPVLIAVGAGVPMAAVIDVTPAEAAWVCNLPGRAGKLNMRACPSYSCRIKGVYREGTHVAALSHRNWWIRVRVNGKIGWMRQRHLCGDDIDFG